MASWFFERKLGDGYRDTFDQSDWCLTFLFCQACISLLHLPYPRAKRKTVLKVKCFKEASLFGSKGAFVSWCKTRERIPLWPLGLSLETIQETSEIFVLADINGWVSQFISNGWSVTINGARLQLPVLKKVHKEVSNRLNRGALKSTWLVMHHFVKMVHFAPLTDLVDPLWGDSILAATASEKSYSLIAETLGAMHGDLDWSDFCEGYDWRAVSTGCEYWAGSVGFGWTWPLDPRTKACWASLDQSEWFSCMGSPATSPPLCPIWLLVGRRMCPDPPMADWVHPLLWPQDPVPVTQTEATCCWTSWQIGLFGVSATCCILSEKPLEEETTLFEWSGLALIACLPPHPAGLECVGLWESLVSWHTRSRFSIVGQKVGPTSCLLPCLCMTPPWCCRLLSVLSCLGRSLWTLVRLEGLLWVPGSSYAVCFLEGTRFLVQCTHLTEHPTLLLAVVAGLWVHFLLSATIAKTWELGSPFLVIPVLCSCFWDATVWVSCAAGPGELAFLWLLINLLGTWTAGPDKPTDSSFNIFSWRFCHQSAVGWTGPEVQLVAYKIEDLFGLQLWFL